MDLGLIPLEHPKLDINTLPIWDMYGIYLGSIPYTYFHIPYL